MSLRKLSAIASFLLLSDLAHGQSVGGPGLGGDSGSFGGNTGGGFSRRPPGDGPDLYGITYDVRYDEETWDRRFATEFLWEQKLEDRPVTGPCIIGDRIMLAFHGRSLRAYSRGSGTTLWTTELPGDVAGELRDAGGDVALVTLQGDAMRLRASDGDTVFRAHLAQEIRNSPTMVGDLMIVTGRDDLVFALEAKTGKVRWKAATGGKGLTAPAVSEGKELVLVGDEDGVLHARSLKDGEERWRYQADGDIVAAPAVSERRAFVVSGDRRLHGVDLADGDRHWRHVLGAGATAAPVVDDDLVVVATLDNLISGYDIDNGFREWKAKLPRRVMGSLRLRDGVVYVTPSASTDTIAFKAENGYELGKAKLKESDDHTVGSAGVHEGDIVMATYGKKLMAYHEVTSLQVEEGEAELPKDVAEESTIDLSTLPGLTGKTPFGGSAIK